MKLPCPSKPARAAFSHPPDQGFKLKIKSDGRKVFAIYPEGSLFIGPDKGKLQEALTLLKKALPLLEGYLTSFQD